MVKSQLGTRVGSSYWLTGKLVESYSFGGGTCLFWVSLIISISTRPNCAECCINHMLKYKYLEVLFRAGRVVEGDSVRNLLVEVAQHLANQQLHLFGSFPFFQIFF